MRMENSTDLIVSYAHYARACIRIYVSQGMQLQLVCLRIAKSLRTERELEMYTSMFGKVLFEDRPCSSTGLLSPRTCSSSGVTGHHDGPVGAVGEVTLGQLS